MLLSLRWISFHYAESPSLSEPTERSMKVDSSPIQLLTSLGFCLSFFLLLASLVSLDSAAQAPAAQAPDTKIKNVLFIVSDDLKADVLGCYGDKFCKTPNIDRLAKSGMLFERAYCQGTWCAPSRTSFMFSRYKGRAQTNLGQHLKENGFYSARVGKIYHMRVPGDIEAGTDGKDIPESWTEKFNSAGKECLTPGNYACLNLNEFKTEIEGRQSTAMPHRMFVTVRYEGDGSDQPDHKSATKAIELLDKHGDKPFFLAVGLVRPHYPMVAPEQYFKPYPWQKMPMPKQVLNDRDDIPRQGHTGIHNGNNKIGEFPDNQKRMWQAYYASVTFMDEQVGRILDHLDKKGLRESTAIIFTSDHGYHLGEHGFWQKVSLHEEVTRVPLIISTPGMKAGRSKSIVEMVDIFPTASDLVGLEVPKSVQGVSLVPVLKNSEAKVKSGAISFTRGVSWRTRDWAYMRYPSGEEELYDMNKDVKQIHNLANLETHAKTKAAMRNELELRMKKFGLQMPKPKSPKSKKKKAQR